MYASKQVNSELAEAVETGDVGKVRTCVMMQQMSSHKAKWTQETERAAMFANPDSEEVCLLIASIFLLPFGLPVLLLLPFFSLDSCFCSRLCFCLALCCCFLWF